MKTSQSHKFSVPSRASSHQQSSLIEDSGVVCEVTPNLIAAKNNRVAAVIGGKKSVDNQSLLHILDKK